METKREQKKKVREAYVRPATVSTAVEGHCNLLAGSIKGNRQGYGGDHDVEEW